MGLFGKGRKEYIEERMIESQQIYLDGMQKSLEPFVNSGEKIDFYTFWLVHAQNAFQSSIPFGKGSPDWAQKPSETFKEAYWSVGWSTWGDCVAPEGGEPMSYQKAKQVASQYRPRPN